MKVQAISFDCAQTLVDVNWSVGDFAVACAREIGLTPPEDAGDYFRTLYMKRLDEYWRLNQLKAQPLIEQFWVRLDRDWLVAEGLDGNRAPEMYDAAQRLGFEVPSIIFTPYPDVEPCLAKLKGMGLRLAVLSNWDMTLHRVIEMYGWSDYFEYVIASLEEGVEKPNARLFQILGERLNLPLSEILHVGDDFRDDYEGAVAANLKAVQLDRSLQASKAPKIRSLDDIEVALSWN